MENTCHCPELVAEHGLSLLIETSGARILFDAGASPAFAANAGHMGVNLASVNMAVLSHGHYDHGGGLSRFLELNSHASVLVSPHAFDGHFNAIGRDIGLNAALASHPRVVRASETVCSPLPGLTLYAGSVLGDSAEDIAGGMTMVVNGVRQPEDFRHEQYMVIEEAGRRILFSGCSHRGVLRIVRHFRPDVFVGGFHLMKLNPQLDADALLATADELAAYPTIYLTGHCTGEGAFRVMQRRMGRRLRSLSTGQVIDL